MNAYDNLSYNLFVSAVLAQLCVLGQVLESEPKLVKGFTLILLPFDEVDTCHHPARLVAVVRAQTIQDVFNGDILILDINLATVLDHPSTMRSDGGGE